MDNKQPIQNPMSIANSTTDEKAYRTAWLIAGYLKDQLNQQELEELDVWIDASPANQRLFEQISDERNRMTGLAWWETLPVEKRLQHIKLRLAIPEKQLTNWMNACWRRYWNGFC